jgi:hypothetical protein
MSKFKYQQRDDSTLEERATRSSGLYDSMFNEGYQSTTFPAGDHTIRILPPTWKGAKHWGFTHFIHYDVGPDNQRYLCNERMSKGVCPVCETARRAVRAGDDKYAKKLRASERVLVWLVDRSREKDGPRLWSLSWGIDKDIAKLCRDRRTKKPLWIDNPETGFDLDFSVENVTTDAGKKIAKPGNFAVARSTSPLCDDQQLQDEWLDFIAEHPLDAALRFYPAEKIEQAFAGVGGKEEGDDPEADLPTTRNRPRDDRDREDRTAFRERIDETGQSGNNSPRRATEEAEDEPVDDAPAPRRSRAAAEPAEEPAPARRRREPAPEDEPANDEPRRARSEAGERPAPSRVRTPVDDQDDPPAEPRRRREPEPAPAGRSARVSEAVRARKPSVDEED